MVGERYRALGALVYVTAFAALEEAGVAAAIEQKDDLLTARKAGLDRLHQLGRQHDPRIPSSLLGDPGLPPSVRRVPARDRRSTTRTGGSAPPATRVGSETFLYFPRSTFTHDSSDGVALPNTQAAPSRRARMTATSRA